MQYCPSTIRSILKYEILEKVTVMLSGIVYSHETLYRLGVPRLPSIFLLGHCIGPDERQTVVHRSWSTLQKKGRPHCVGVVIVLLCTASKNCYDRLSKPILATRRRMMMSLATTTTGSACRHGMVPKMKHILLLVPAKLQRSSTRLVPYSSSAAAFDTTPQQQQSRRWRSSSASPPPTSTTTTENLAAWYIWGSNKNGYLNSFLASTATTSSSPPPPAIVWEPTPITWTPPNGAKIQSVVCGPTSGKSNSTAIVLDNGQVYVAGDNAQGHLGVGHANPVPTLTHLEFDVDGAPLPPMSQVVFGSAPNMAMISKENGDLYTCGFGGSLVQGTGWLGHGNGDSYMTPKRVDSLVEDGCCVQSVVLGDAHMTVLTTEGEVLSAGASSYGRLGNGETHGVDQLYLEPVELLQGGGGGRSSTSTTTRRADMTLVGGKTFTMALKEGILYVWGRNHKGQLGTGFGMAVDMYSMENVPTPMDRFDGNELLHQEIVQVSAGPSHAACVTKGGELYVWGMGTYLEPHKVQQVLHTKIINVFCGGNDSTYALSEAGHLYVWGKGGKKSGMLGLSEVSVSSATSLNLQHQPHLLKSLAMEHAVVELSVGNSVVAAKCVPVPLEDEDEQQNGARQ
jgi:alpha-tubulin suppressor-like RCC1 family protein